VNVEVEVGSQDALAHRFRERFRTLLDAAVARRGRFCWALPGGSAAEAFLPALAGTLVDWKRVDHFWGDERAVKPDHADSNYALARRLLLDRVDVDPGRVHRIPADSPDLSRAAEAYAEALIGTLGDPPRLDLALLGVGPDGHVCSLFPGHPVLAEMSRWVAPLSDSPKPPPGRITLTRRALAEAEVVCVAAFGEAKAEVVRAALEDPVSPLPVSMVAREARRVLFLLDPAAAGRTPRAS
jgi:6-phosphogluconolactonase